MSGIQRFEEKEAWEKARELTKVIYTLSNDGLIRYPAKSEFKGIKYK